MFLHLGVGVGGVHVKTNAISAATEQDQSFAL